MLLLVTTALLAIVNPDLPEPDGGRRGPDAGVTDAGATTTAAAPDAGASKAATSPATAEASSPPSHAAADSPAPTTALPSPATSSPPPTRANEAIAGPASPAPPSSPPSTVTASGAAPAPVQAALDAKQGPAPPAGELDPLAPATDDEAADEPESDEPESPELAAMHALEDASLAAPSRGDAALRELLRTLPADDVTREHLALALEHAEQQGESLPTLDPVTDLSTLDMKKLQAEYDIPIEMQPLVAQYVQFFQGAGRKWFRRWLSRSQRYIPLMQPVLEARGLPRDTVYLAMIESGFNTQAKSWARAVGPWQFIAGTAKLFQLKEDFWRDERRDPLKATHAAASYLSLLYRTLGHWYLAWAGYNTGGARVRWLIEKHGTRDFWELSEKKKGLAKETKHYVPKLIACALVAKHPQAFGFTPDEIEPMGPFEYDEVQLTDAVDLEVVAQAAGATVEEIQELNPELKRWCTPPASAAEPYVLRVPKGRKASFEGTIATLAPQERLKFRLHTVAKGETLSKIAQKYRSAPEAIMRMNGLTSAKSLKLGLELAVPVPSAALAKTAEPTKVDAAIERQVARARRSGVVAARPDEEVPAGAGAVHVKGASGGSFSVDSTEGKRRVLYAIARGDSLWSVARRFDVHVSELRDWNENLGSARGLRVGQQVVIYPGEKADLGGAVPSAPAKAAPASASTTKPAPPAATTKPAPAPAPASTAVAKKGAASSHHVVASGDTLWAIAQQYDVSVADLKSWNNLQSNKLKLGQKLLVTRK